MYRIGQEEIDEVVKVLQSGQMFRVGSPDTGHLGECDKFEKEWGEVLGSKYVLFMCGGGTAALVCALAGLGIGPGDEVIVPAYTWMSTATSVLTVGAIPVLAEVDETMALDPDDLERKIGPNTKAVIPVHMMGRPANMERICQVAAKHGIKVLEDSCQMDGGSYKGKRTGTWGDAGAFSFNWYKILSCGEGGCLVTDNRSVYETAVAFADSGTAFRPAAAELNIPIFVAQQYRADEVMGAIMRMQLRKMDGILTDLRHAARRIEAATNGQHGLHVTASNDRDGDCGVVVSYQFADYDTASNFLAATGLPGYVGINHGKHVYVEWTPLVEKRIMHHKAMNPFYFPQNQGLRADYSPSACPKTLELLRRTVFMPMNPELKDDQIDAMAEQIVNAAAKIGLS